MPRKGFNGASLLARLLLALASLVILTFAAPALADKRVALVIGNSSYRSVPHLDNPANDAKLMAKTLRGLGFELVGDGAQIDLDKAGFESALQKFGNQVLGADVGLFYYAGHGLQIDGKNFLVPIEANPTKEADVFLQMIDTQVVLSQMEGAGTKLNIVLLDACRNSPFGGRGLRATSGGLAQMQAPEGTLISYATQPGNVATDGADGDSPYTLAVADTISRPGLGLFDAFNEVGVAVKRATGGAQQPWVASSPIEGSFYFAGAPQAAVTPPPTTAPLAEATPAKTPPIAVAIADASRTTDGPAPTRPGASPTAPPTGNQKDSAGQAPPVQTAALPPTQPTSSARGAASAVADCDRLAGLPRDPGLTPGVAGVDFQDIDPVPALAACRAAIAEQADDPRVAFELGRAISKSGGSDADALALYRKAAAAGHAGAMHNLGIAYETGKGVDRNLATALDWFRKSANGGDTAAMVRMGFAYKNGEGVPLDYVQALQWFRKAADGGAAAGMTDVGLAYQSGRGVAKNPIEAVAWFRKAAAANGAGGMNLLGLAYLHGAGVPRDPAEAVKWFQQSAAAGNREAMLNLGKSYADGVGVARDKAQAELWLQRAQK